MLASSNSDKPGSDSNSVGFGVSTTCSGNISPATNCGVSGNGPATTPVAAPS